MLHPLYFYDGKPERRVFQLQKLTISELLAIQTLICDALDKNKNETKNENGVFHTDTNNPKHILENIYDILMEA